jgi:serine/threonine protein kinase
VAALNHPHICQLYDVGPGYLVMELVEGTRLKGPLPVDKAVEYAGQILNAPDAAHRKGITHRDLKPANILVTNRASSCSISVWRSIPVVPFSEPRTHHCLLRGQDTPLPLPHGGPPRRATPMRNGAQARHTQPRSPRGPSFIMH